MFSKKYVLIEHKSKYTKTIKQKFAIPFTNKQLSNHFGKAEYFEIIETENRSIISTTRLKTPVHEHGKLPTWIADKGVTHIISGGIGQK